jgi:HPt (histidine-containing phosphotransfer) domain-containing protein
MADEKRRAAEVGMNGFLTKPIAPKNLQAYLLHILGKNTPVENALSDTTVPENIPPGSFSLDYLLELSNGDLHFVHDILQAFLTETPAELQLLYSSANAGAWDDVRKTVHKLKPNFAMLGMQHLHEQVLHIESCIQQKQPHNVLSNLTHQLIASTEALFEVIAAHKNGFLTP